MSKISDLFIENARLQEERNGLLEERVKLLEALRATDTMTIEMQNSTIKKLDAEIKKLQMPLHYIEYIEYEGKGYRFIVHGRDVEWLKTYAIQKVVWTQESNGFWRGEARNGYYRICEAIIVEEITQ